MLVGFLLIAVGIGLSFWWTQEFFFVLKGTLILGLFLAGLISLLIGASKRKAHRNWAKAQHDEVSDETGDE